MSRASDCPEDAAEIGPPTVSDVVIVIVVAFAAVAADVPFDVWRSLEVRRRRLAEWRIRTTRLACEVFPL